MVYGESKVGKSSFAVTAPYPRLMLDVEGGHRFLPIVVKYWDPLREEPPLADGTWDTCVVTVRDYDTVLKTYQWLQLGKHHFKSLIIDSISELQVKCMDSIAGNEQMKMQQWGELLRHMGGLLRDLRDLTMHPTNILGALTIEQFPNPDPLQPPYKVRRMYVERTNEYEAGERVQGRLGAIVEQDKLSIEVMLNEIFGAKQVASAEKTTTTNKKETEVPA